MKKSTKMIIIFALIAAVIAGGYLWHISEVNAVRKNLLDEQAQAALMAQRVQDIQNQLNYEKEEKQSLLSQIDDLLTEEVAVFDAASIHEQIMDIGELGTVEYCYTHAGTVDAVKHFSNTGWKVPFSSKTAIVTMDGIITVGVDVTQIEIATDEATKTITVTIPEAAILSNELLEETMMVYEEKESLFSNITLADNSALRMDIKNNAAQKAIDGGLLEQAREKAGGIVRCLIEAVPAVKGTYTIVVC